jgi:hypothetical protein
LRDGRAQYDILLPPLLGSRRANYTTSNPERRIPNEEARGENAVFGETGRRVTRLKRALRADPRRFGDRTDPGIAKKEPARGENALLR